MMQYDPTWENRTFEKTKIESGKENSVVQNKSVSTYDSYQTGESKRSTEEEELRSLSTTPRYSHEDLGRIVSPPHSSDFSTGEADDNFDDTLSAQQVLLKSRTTQLTNRQTLPVSDKVSVNSYRSQNTQNSSVISEKGYTKPIEAPYKKRYVYYEKGSPRLLQESRINNEEFHNLDKSPRTKYQTISTKTAPQLQSSKASKEYHNKPNSSDHSFQKSVTGNERNSVSIKSNTNRNPSSVISGKTRNTASNNRLSVSVKSGNKRFPTSVRTDYSLLRAADFIQLTPSVNISDILMDTEKAQRDLINENERRESLEKELQSIEEERKELNTKLATLRVKLGVANSNYNVSKNECDAMRKKFQETQIQKARLEERIGTCSKDLEKLKDPNNPDSNVNLKKVVLNDRKEIRRLRTELEGVRSERSEVQKQIQDKDEKIKKLNVSIGEAKEQLEEVNHDFEVAKIAVEAERKKREEVEEMYSELLKDKHEFDEKMAEINEMLEVAISGTSGIQKHTEQYREKEQSLVSRIEEVEKKLRDTLTSIEQFKNKDMPLRTATSIKHHQYRMTASGWVTDTTPHVIVTTNANGSIAASGYLGKSVVSTNPAKSLPGSKGVSKTTPRSTGGSLPSKR
ncbi:centrosomal protein of 112 kDa-like [Ruditapes philippinarum]|uniref:centrosomal protein of 112 kDa-like n=1 Tax=Ruditapes philippinarum TaxID=129788 RepID=UPI00295B4173|nr:centrosomal protein of 112 kDa-like [Ruditapes philippinarum]XP_060599521.1 centrosomal protein of 112 kDa-like [Ruditapes philippinarum]